MENATEKPRPRGRRKIILTLLTVLVVLLAAAGYAYYKVVYTKIHIEAESYLYIRTNDRYEDVFKQLTEKGFGQRRKMLRQSLKGIEGAVAAAEALGIDSTRRAETVSVNEWAALARALGA